MANISEQNFQEPVRRDVLSKNDGWGSLCEFLEKPEPEIPFPFLNKAPAWSEGSISD
jgi:hypothetical protein